MEHEQAKSPRKNRNELLLFPDQECLSKALTETDKRQFELAAEAGLSTATISRVMRGEPVRAATANLIAMALSRFGVTDASVEKFFRDPSESSDLSVQGTGLTSLAHVGTLGLGGVATASVAPSQSTNEGTKEDAPRIGSISQFIARIIEIARAWGLPYGDIWYRGVIRSTYKLVPGFLWRGLENESDLVDDFLVSSPAYTQSIPNDSWELYGLLQHYGLPTRLLDWTKSPLSALFFALDETVEPLNEDPPVVWILDPRSIRKNDAAKGGVHSHPFVDTPTAIDETLDSYLPIPLRRTAQRKSLPELPIAFEPRFSNARITAQEGCFTIHGSDPRPLGEFVENGRLLRIEIDPTLLNEIWIELDQMGYRGERLYHSLDRLSKRIIEARRK